MRFFIDAQLPKQLARILVAAGHDAMHTLDLPQKNQTPDAAILDWLDADPRILVTKDEDFVNSHVLQNRPSRLLLISTGNIGNRDLLALVEDHLPEIVAAFEQAKHVELGRMALVVHG